MLELITLESTLESTLDWSSNSSRWGGTCCTPRYIAVTGQLRGSYIAVTLQLHCRYLLHASSGGRARLPANLQGVWADSLRPPWGADFHININLQMAYWLAFPTGLLEVRPQFHCSFVAVTWQLHYTYIATGLLEAGHRFCFITVTLLFRASYIAAMTLVLSRCKCINVTGCAALEVLLHHYAYMTVTPPSHGPRIPQSAAPLLPFLRRLASSGKRVARHYFGSRREDAWMAFGFRP